MLHKYGLSVAKEEADKVDTLRYTWDKLLSRNTELQNELFALQPKFHGELTRNVETFQEDCEQFYLDYEKVNEMSDRNKIQLPVVNLRPTLSMLPVTSPTLLFFSHPQMGDMHLKCFLKLILLSQLQDGPMVLGIAPQDASDRLIMFQVR